MEAEISPRHWLSSRQLTHFVVDGI
jgi:hypothetical protein